MERALIVTGTEAGVKTISELLSEFKIAELVPVYNGGEARRCLAEKEFDLVVVNTPLRDEFGTTLACHVAETTTAGIILLTKAENAAEIMNQAQPSGVFVIEKPLSRGMFQQTIRILETVEARLRMMQRENQRLQVKMEEIRIVDRAKLVLMDCLKMNEDTAHHYIEKQAMDMRCTRAEIAQSIIRTYRT